MKTLNAAIVLVLLLNYVNAQQPTNSLPKYITLRATSKEGVETVFADKWNETVFIKSKECVTYLGTIHIRPPKRYSDFCVIE